MGKGGRENTEGKSKSEKKESRGELGRALESGTRDTRALAQTGGEVPGQRQRGGREKGAEEGAVGVDCPAALLSSPSS